MDGDFYLRYDCVAWGAADSKYYSYGLFWHHDLVWRRAGAGGSGGLLPFGLGLDFLASQEISGPGRRLWRAYSQRTGAGGNKFARLADGFAAIVGCCFSQFVLKQSVPLVLGLSLAGGQPCGDESVEVVAVKSFGGASAGDLVYLPGASGRQRLRRHGWAASNAASGRFNAAVKRWSYGLYSSDFEYSIRLCFWQCHCRLAWLFCYQGCAASFADRRRALGFRHLDDQCDDRCDRLRFGRLNDCVRHAGAGMAGLGRLAGDVAGGAAPHRLPGFGGAGYGSPQRGAGDVNGCLRADASGVLL